MRFTLIRPLIRSLGCLSLLCLWAYSSSISGAEAIPSEGLDAQQLAQSVIIYRDEWGVPHIDGPTDESVVFGFAYCQAEDNFWQLEDSYLLALGRYAEAYGKGVLEKDILNHAFEVTRSSKADFETLDPQTQRLAAAFVAGVNYYLEKHPEVKPRLINHFEPWFMLALGRGVVVEWHYGSLGVPRNQVPTAYEEIAAAKGSNAWAIAPARTKSGHAMLFINPHQPYYGYGQFYEGHLRSGEGWNFIGGTFFGSPLPTLGHNEHLGWAFTVNQPNLGNAWTVTFDDPENPLHYRHGDGYRLAEEWTDTIKVRVGRSLIESEYTFRTTHHGPIVQKLNDTQYVAANIGRFREALLSRQNLKMVKAKNLGEFREAMRMLDFHIFNTVYADREGNIY